MKPQRFEIGQPKSNNWVKDNPSDPREMVMSKFGEVYSVQSYWRYEGGIWWITLKEITCNQAFE